MKWTDTFRDDELIVFDLDGTLWTVNSHIDLVEKYMHHHFFSSRIGKMLYLVNSNFFMALLNMQFKKVPDEYIDNYLPELRNNIVDMLRKNQNNSIIITNAPDRIAKRAHEIFNVPVYTAGTGNKLGVLKTLDYEWEYLTVVTDNLTDSDLIKNANRAYIITTEKRKKQFQLLESKVYFDFVIEGKDEQIS